MCLVIARIESYASPVRIIAEIPTFFLMGNCRLHTAGSGTIRMKKSLKILTTPKATFRGLFSEHRGLAIAVKYAL